MATTWTYRETSESDVFSQWFPQVTHKSPIEDKKGTRHIAGNASVGFFQICHHWISGEMFPACDETNKQVKFLATWRNNFKADKDAIHFNVKHLSFDCMMWSSPVGEHHGFEISSADPKKPMTSCREHHLRLADVKHNAIATRCCWSWHDVSKKKTASKIHEDNPRYWWYWNQVYMWSDVFHLPLNH